MAFDWLGGENAIVGHLIIPVCRDQHLPRPGQLDDLLKRLASWRRILEDKRLSCGLLL